MIPLWKSALATGLRSDSVAVPTGPAVVVDGDRFLVAAELAERDPLVDERLRDRFAQWQLGRGAEAGEQIVVDGDRLLAAAERAERDPLVDERVGDPFAQRQLGRGAEAAEQSS